MASKNRSSPRWLSGDETDVKLYSVVAVSLAALAILDGIFDFVSDSVFIAAIFGALYLVLRLTLKLVSVERDMSEVLTRVQDRTTALRFENYDELYEALRYRLRSANKGLRLTHVRDDPPAVFGHEDFYEAVREWPGSHPACKVERIIATPNEAMRAWGEQLREDERANPNFRVRVTTRSAGLPVINMVILDDLDVFLFVSGETAQDTAGLWLTGEGVARDFAVFFDQMFAKSIPLEHALAESRQPQSPA